MTVKQKLTKNGFKIRPTLIIGLGGTGHRIALFIKALLTQILEPEMWEQWVKILVLDTAHEELSASASGGKVVVEPGHEFVDIGQVPVDRIKRNLKRQPAIEERLGAHMTHIPPVVLRNGARQIRPLGLVAFLWRYGDIEKALREAIWALAGREHNDGQEGINVFIANSLGGGTGSSIFLDTAYLVRELFDDLGSLADFCHISGVGVLPRAFHGINGPNLVPNSVASLIELDHCMMNGGFHTRYPSGRVVKTEQPPFNIYYLVDGVDERGHTWRGQNEVCRLAAEAIFLQMGSQVGQKHENDFDNLEDVLFQKTDDGHGTFYGSFGLASVVFPGKAVAKICAARQVICVIENGLLTPVLSTDKELDHEVEQFIEAAGLVPKNMSEYLTRDDEGLVLIIDLPLPRWARRHATAEIPAEVIRYVRDYEQTRLGGDFNRWLNQNQERLIRRTGAELTKTVSRLTRQNGLPCAIRFLERLSDRQKQIAQQVYLRETDRENRQSALDQEMDHLEMAFLQAGESNFLWRGRRVARAQHAYLTTAQNLFDLRWQAQVTSGMLAILNKTEQEIQYGLRRCRDVSGRLKAVWRKQDGQAKVEHNTFKLAGVTTQSLATAPLVDALHQQFAPTGADTMAILFSNNNSPLDWCDTDPEKIEAALLRVCQPPFQAIREMGVEQVIQMQKDVISPEAQHTRLVGQATPSWNLDRTRLPDGGADLHLLEVTGVPNEAGSIYRRHAKTLVSTGDPERITAFVARIGAPHTAIQQWGNYMAAYEQARGSLPLHILPQFQADNDRARQTFALGFIFNFITNQGAYFYYSPADSLARPQKLAQGLENSLQAFTGQEQLVHEVRERVELQVAAQGVETTLRKLIQYYETPGSNGRYTADELVLELKRLVRSYADELRQIHQLNPGDEPAANLEISSHPQAKSEEEPDEN